MAGEEQGLQEQESGVATSLELQAEGVPRPELQLRAGSWSQAGSAPGCGVPEPAKVAQALVCPFARGQRPSQAVPRLCTQLPSQAPCRPGGRSPSHSSCTDPSSPVRGQTSSLRVPAPAVGSWFPHWSLSSSSWESFLCPSSTSSHQRSAVPAHPLQQSRGPGGDPARDRVCQLKHPSPGKHLRPGERSEKGQRGPGEERGEESVLLRARNPPGLILLPQLPLPERILPSLWDWAGRRAKRCGLCGLTDQPLPYLCPE